MPIVGFQMFNVCHLLHWQKLWSSELFFILTLFHYWKFQSFHVTVNCFLWALPLLKDVILASKSKMVEGGNHMWVVYPSLRALKLLVFFYKKRYHHHHWELACSQCFCNCQWLHHWNITKHKKENKGGLMGSHMISRIVIKAPLGVDGITDIFINKICRGGHGAIVWINMWCVGVVKKLWVKGQMF
jgi:hypothetical protein